MFARRALRRPGVGVIGESPYAAGPSVAKPSAQEAFRDEQLAEPQAEAQAPSTGLTDEKLDQLRKLGEMKKEGILTHEEFEAQKQRLLS
jgi:hypothetical protein